MRGQNILVTGGAGYIGSQVCKHLAQAGFTPVTYDDFRNGNPWAVKWGPLVVGDLADTQLLQRTFEVYAILAVVHCAADAYVGESMKEPDKYFRNNTVNTLGLLEAMRRAAVRHMIFSSSCATYGAPSSQPIQEAAPQDPTSPYGESKLLAERMIKWHCHTHSLRCVVLRFFNAAGADPDGEVGEAHSPETHLIPLVIRAATTPDHITIHGTDYPTPDGTCVRDYTHVSDIADAHLLALDYLLKGGETDAFNLGLGTGHSVRQVITAVEQVAGVPPQFKVSSRRQGDPPVLVACANKARNLLGWSPRFETLNSIVETAWNWHQSEESR